MKIRKILSNVSKITLKSVAMAWLLPLTIKYNTSMPKIVFAKLSEGNLGKYVKQMIIIDPHQTALVSTDEFKKAILHEYRHHWQWTHRHKEFIWWMEHKDLYRLCYHGTPIEIDARRFEKTNGKLDDSFIFDKMLLDKIKEAAKNESIQDYCQYWDMQLPW